MEEMSKHGQIGLAAMRAGMDRKTARKYVAAGEMPSEMTKEREWKTREDPFAEHWPELEARLVEAPGLEAKTLFELLVQGHPGRYEPGQLRTLQRRIKVWRASRGPEKEVVLAQQHRPGEAAQTDFTWVTELAITIAGQLFVHMLCVFTLPYSNWRWATVCLSESIAAIRKGVQRSLFQLGRAPTYHQTDNSTAATHRIPDGKSVVAEDGKRPFNEDYLALMRHFGMTARTTQVGEKQQNGDAEASNRVIKSALEQALLVRGSRDFESVEAWQSFVDDVLRKGNRAQGKRVAEDLAAMRELAVDRLPEFVEEDVLVSEWSTVRVKHCSYSVPSRLIGEWVKVRIFEDRIQVRYAGKTELDCERMRGKRHQRCIDYRHVIWSLVQKPGGFARYVYREEMFPSVVFRRAYDAIQSPHHGVKGDLEYLRILHHAASSMEADVEAALSLLLAEGKAVTATAVKALVAAAKSPIEVPDLAPLRVDLVAYDGLIDDVVAEVGT